MPFIHSFTTPEEDAATAEFLQRGYLIRDVDDRDVLDSLRHEIVRIVCNHLHIPLPADDGVFLNTIHTIVPVAKLNEMRLATFNALNALPWFRPTYFGLARRSISLIVGNELAMQQKVNLSVQYPNDESSLLSVHADTWSEESPFQVVEWMPFVDVFETKSMYILSPEQNRTLRTRVKSIAEAGGSDTLFQEYEKHFEWLRIPYGKVLLFSPILLHGNVVNRTAETRWSMNCRVKGLFTPYMSEEKKLGSFYLPITTKAMSRVGSKYTIPEGFND